jgi:PAN domain
MRSLILGILLLSCPTAPVSAQEAFDVGRDFVPEGKPKRRSSISTVEQCQTACAVNAGCKAYAFRTSKPACYFYSQVFMGGTPRSREMGIYSSGLSIVPKSGFVSAFKRSSFPPPPVPVRPD